MTITEDDAMTGPEFRSRREFLGLTRDELALAMHSFQGGAGDPIRADTLRDWETSKRGQQPSERAVATLGEIEEVTREWVEAVADWLEDGDEVPWREAPWVVQPNLRVHQGWWPQVVARAHEIVRDSIPESVDTPT